jgi:hypothetical protein
LAAPSTSIPLDHAGAAPLGALDWGGGSLVGLLVLYVALILLAYQAPPISHWIEHNSDDDKPKSYRFGTAVRSISGGMAAAYVFLVLIPELKVFDETIQGSYLNAYVLALCGLVLFKGLQHLCLHLVHQRSKAHQEWGFIHAHAIERSLDFKVASGVFCIYASLVILTLPFQFSHLAGPVDRTLYLVTFVFHLGLVMLGLYEEDAKAFHRFVPRSVSVSLTVALVLALAKVLPAVLVIAFMSLLAGIIMFQVFRTELPAASRSSFSWFVFGTTLFTAIHQITQRAGGH